MGIGEKIKRLRIKNGLTQEELAMRSELSKGFISQVERDLTSPSISTLVDILECLGTNLKDFFNEKTQEKLSSIPKTFMLLLTKNCTLKNGGAHLPKESIGADFSQF